MTATVATRRTPNFGPDYLRLAHEHRGEGSRRRHRWIVVFAGTLLLLATAASPVAAAEPLTLIAHLTGAAEVPPVNSGAGGEAVVVINAERTEMRYRITYWGLSSPLRLAAFCIGWSSSDVVCPFIGSELPRGSSPLNGTRSIVGIQAANWTSGQAWVQMETTKYPQGEIRGLLARGAPDTSTMTVPRGAPVDRQFPILVLLGAIGAGVFLRRLDTQRGERGLPSRRLPRSSCDSHGG